MQLTDFDFDLPDTLIATRPMVPRTAAKLLLGQGCAIQDKTVADLVDILQPGDHLILNDTKVIPARLSGFRERDSAQGLVRAKIEVTMLDPVQDGAWRCLIKPLRKLAEGEVVQFAEGFSATCTLKSERDVVLTFQCDDAPLDAKLEQHGAMPLPPYIAAKRPADAQDKTDYQTVWAKNTGAVAAPTASLHLDEDMLAQLAAIGVKFSYVTLHVGAGTFLPVQVDDVTTHKMHAEWGEVTAQTVDEIKATKAAGGRVIPVGTTALRLVETAARSGQLKPWTGDTDIFIYPGFEFQVTDGLMTNFHLPKSTLLMLVSALMGKAQMDAIYAHAVANQYRFFSYGDASVLFPLKA